MDPAAFCARAFRFKDEEHWVLWQDLGRAAEPELTQTERAIAAAMLNGASNRAIASARGRSVNTIANQIAALYKKLGVRSRQELWFAMAHLPAQTGEGGLNEELRSSARGAASASADHEAAALVTGAWTVVDHFDSEGRRYVITRPATSPLPEADQAMLGRRARGHAVKEIAIDLGLSSATVSRRLRRAREKLGLGSASVLPRLLAAPRGA